MRAAAYARYSTDRQTDNSIAYQLDKINDYCLREHIDIVAVYTDEGCSGTNTEREGFQALLAAAQRKEFEAVVIYDISRGSRDVGDWFTFRKQMMMLGVRVISTEQDLGELTDSNKFLLELITVGVGQAEVLNTRQKSIDGVAVKAKQGLFLGGRPPLGYDVVQGRYIVNPSEADIVRKIFAAYADGESYDAILRAIPGATGKLGRPLGKNSLHSILNNERYIGVYTWNKRKIKMLRKWAGGAPNPACVRIENAIPQIIDRNTWERVKARMADNKRNAANGNKRRKYLLSGLIKCDCGATYVGHTTINTRGYESSFYVCGNKYRTHTCKSKNINATEIETFVVQHLKAYFLDTDFEDTAQIIADRVNAASKDCEAEKRELVELETQIANGTKAIIGGLDYPELRDELSRLRTRKSELEDIVAAKQKENGKIDPAAIVKMFKHSIENWNDENLPQIIREHIKNIYAHPDGSYEVEIGVHSVGCGGRRFVLCAILQFTRDAA